MNKYEELKYWTGVYETNDDMPDNQQESTSHKIELIKESIELLIKEEKDIVDYCTQCLHNDRIINKALYRQFIAKKYTEQIQADYTDPQSQSKLKEIIDLYELNIDEAGNSSSDLYNWFNAVSHLQADKDKAIEILEECEYKLECWIEQGYDKREFWLYRYIVRFLRDFEMNSLKSVDSQRILEDIETKLKQYAQKFSNKTAVVYWISKYGNGLGRLISHREFQRLSSQDKLATLQLFEGRLPSRECFLANTAFIIFNNHKVFFSPLSIRSRLTETNAGDFVDFGFGFTYDGLRSY